MKKLLFIAIILFSCFPLFAQSEPDEGQEYVAADKELNSVYQKILKEYGKDPAFIKNLKTAQKIWVQFRDAETDMKYPDREPGYYGSAYPACRTLYMADLTNARINTLKVWLVGIEEGDVCTGSVKRKE